MNVLTITQFGDPLLRKKARALKITEITSPQVRQLIVDMRHMLTSQKLGVALAAPQVGRGIRLVVIAVRPMPHRPKVKKFDLVLINPKIIEYGGSHRALWEGCISSGSDGRANLFAKVPRASRVKLEYYDEQGQKHTKSLTGLQAQVVQHEVDHLSGVLFVDHVQDPTTYMTYKEYIKRVRKVKITG